ncbi:hypothetical protein CDAR_190761 [Caerostris darwini]|uniref:Uncharacterized protein n=1 Tax=Caerostris darwini TaxID=1538125 RepID=A0AAV4VC75_9ARAC|nr:hypothetical protein CDAR_190761 [Caerostris darwini]
MVRITQRGAQRLLGNHLLTLGLQKRWINCFILFARIKMPFSNTRYLTSFHNQNDGLECVPQIWRLKGLPDQLHAWRIEVSSSKSRSNDLCEGFRDESVLLNDSDEMARSVTFYSLRNAY